MTSLLGITLFVLALMLAIFLHEGGHFATAKFFGMKVERFFLGFGPTIWSFRRGETEYGVKALPLGGFCKIAGMSPYENDGNFLEEDRSAKAGRQPDPAGAAVPQQAGLAAGDRARRRVDHPLPGGHPAHLDGAGGHRHRHRPGHHHDRPHRPASNAGTPSPAQTGGLQAGDQIVAVDGNQVATFEELRTALQTTGGEQITIDYVRDGERRSTTVTPVEQDGRGFLGFQPSEETRRVGVLAAIPESIELFWDTTVATVKGLGGFVTGLADRMSAPEPAPRRRRQAAAGRCATAAPSASSASPAWPARPWPTTSGRSSSPS